MLSLLAILFSGLLIVNCACPDSTVQFNLNTSLKSMMFLGTGSSYSLPMLTCIPPCKACESAASSSFSKNRRRNTSLFLQGADGSHGIIDCGKTFVESARDFLLPMKVKRLDYVILSHGHSDAMLGLDDLRAYTDVSQTPIPVYADSQTWVDVKRIFAYIFSVRKENVPKLTSNMFEPFQPFQIMNTKFEAVPVEHGNNPDGSPYMSNGFLIDEKIFHVSDVSRIQESTMNYLTAKHSIELLIIDCSSNNVDTPGHIGLDHVMRIHAIIKPRLTILTDISHLSEHYELQSMLPDNIMVGFDGLIVEFKA